MFHSDGGGGGGMAAAAHEPGNSEQRQRKPEPKRVWLDAIMSKTRQNDTSPFASAASSASSGASYVSAHSQQMGMTAKKTIGSSPAALHPPPSMPHQQQERWEPSPRGGHFSGNLASKQSSSMVYDPSLRAEPVVATRSGVPSEYYQRAPPPPQQQMSNNDMHQEQLELDDSILAETVSLAFKQMVGEQDCCFIAKGICHLCGTNERHLIPVVNFCPEFHVNHSLCREHLRSMHRVRMEDIFAGKNRPTVSKRSLKCSVCSRSCPCSTCQLEKQHEISKYKRWLAGEREYELDSEDRSMGNSSIGGDQPARMRNPLPLSKKPRSSFGSNSSGGGGREYLPNAGQSLRELHSAQRLLPPVVDDSRSFQMSPHVDLSNQDEERSMVPNLQAGAKPPSHAYRSAKRAAKDVKSSHPPALNVSGVGAAFGPNAVGQSPLKRVHPNEPIESPSATHVLNCAESEKSLVRLLTTLNQEVASGATPALAEPKDSGSQPTVPSANGPNTAASRRQPSPLLDGHHPSSTHSVDAHNGANKEKTGPRSTAGAAGSSSNTDAGDAGLSVSSRNPKRKRDANDSTAHIDSETSSETSASNSRSGQQDHGKTGGGARADSGRKAPPNSTRGTGPQREGTSKPSPSAKLTTKMKQKDARQRPVPKASPTTSSGRKRNGGEPSSHQSSAEKKSPHPRKPTPGSRGTTPRGPKDSSRSADGKRASARKAVQENENDEDDEDSEIDTNLDYCEVCLAAGDLVCCDVCPRSFHLACLKMKESDLPEGDWQCAECRKPSFFVRYRATVEMKQSIYGKCVETIRCLKTHPFSKQFLSPVTNIEHYRSIVKQPMDLSTIEAKLKADKYTKPPTGGVQQQIEKQIDIEAFANDVRLVWANCKLFNDDGSGITRAADELAAGFEDIYQDMQQYVKNMAARSAVRAASKSPSTRGESHPQQAAKSTGGPSTAPRASEGKKVGAADNNGGNSGPAASVASKKVEEGKQPEGPASTPSTESEPRQPGASRAPLSSNTDAAASTSTTTAAPKPAAEPKTRLLSTTESKAPANEAKFSSSSDKPVDEKSKGE